MVMASLAWGTRGNVGMRRPTRRYTEGFQETHWLKYEQMLLDRTQEIKKKLGNRRPSDRLTILQKELMNAAAEVGGGIHEGTTRPETRKKTGMAGGKNNSSIKKKKPGKGKDTKSSNGADISITRVDTRWEVKSRRFPEEEGDNIGLHIQWGRKTRQKSEESE
eukprot:6193654-Pleurochrysis_carterae.AAC.1